MTSNNTMYCTKTSRHKFTQEEDDMLRKLVEELGVHAWKKVASRIHTKNTRQCRERYINYLSPSIQNLPWSPDEDRLLASKVKEMGQQWSKIVTFFKGRSDVNIKNRHALLVSKGIVERGISFHPLIRKRMKEMNQQGVMGDAKNDTNQNEKQGNEFFPWNLTNDEWMNLRFDFEMDEANDDAENDKFSQANYKHD